MSDFSEGSINEEYQGKWTNIFVLDPNELINHKRLSSSDNKVINYCVQTVGKGLSNQFCMNHHCNAMSSSPSKPIGAVR